MSLGCDWLAGVFLSISGLLFFTPQRPSGLCAKSLSGCRHIGQYLVRSAICLNSARGSSTIGKEVPLFSLSFGGDCGLAYLIKSTMFTFTIRTTACPAHDPSRTPLRPSIVNLNHHFRIQLLAPRSKAHQSAFQSILIIHYGNQESNRCCARKEGRCRPSACILQRYVVAAYGSTKLSHRFGHDYISVAYMC